MNPNNKKTYLLRNRERRQERPLIEQEQDEQENESEDNDEPQIPEQELPRGNLWTRIIDFGGLGRRTALAYSFDDDKENFKYERPNQI